LEGLAERSAGPSSLLASFFQSLRDALTKQALQANAVTLLEVDAQPEAETRRSQEPMDGII